MDDPASYSLAILADGVQHSTTVITIFAKLFAVLFFVVANGFFVGAEFALVSVRRTRLETRGTAGSRRAQAALRLINDPTFFISATQLGITIASLALGWIGEPTIATLLEPIAATIAPAGKTAYIAHILAIAIAFASITFLHIVLGELMPKMFALERAEALALLVSGPLELFAKKISSLTYCIPRISNSSSCCSRRCMLLIPRDWKMCCGRCRRRKRTLVLSLMSTAAWKASSPLKIFWRRSSATFQTSTMKK